MHEDLTVRENLEYSAWLRSPKYVRTRAKGDLVDDVIHVLNLRSVQHSVVGTAEKRGIRLVRKLSLVHICLCLTLEVCVDLGSVSWCLCTSNQQATCTRAF